MGGTAWFWNGASARSRRAVAMVFVAASCVWVVVDLMRTPIPGSIVVPVFLIVFFGAQWYAATRATRSAARTTDAERGTTS